MSNTKKKLTIEDLASILLKDIPNTLENYKKEQERMIANEAHYDRSIKVHQFRLKAAELALVIQVKEKESV